MALAVASLTEVKFAEMLLLHVQTSDERACHVRSACH